MLLGDIGGLYGLLMSVGGTLIAIINFQKAKNQIATELYKVNKPD